MTAAAREAQLLQAASNAARPLMGSARDYEPILRDIGEASVVLLGESTHGTHEFYRVRAELTERLLEQHGFEAVAVEADWPDAQHVAAFVRGGGTDDPASALGGFQRFPSWMWRNADVRNFAAWLHDHNRARAQHAQVGFYGLDLYSLRASATAVLRYLDAVDPEHALLARERYACLDHPVDRRRARGAGDGLGVSAGCEQEVVRQLLELQAARLRYLAGDQTAAEDRFLDAEQNARVVSNAEAFYRAMYTGSRASWNLRDLHMMEVLEALVRHLQRGGRRGKVVVWAHNSHLGDARATEPGIERGQLNLGQLVRERMPGRSYSLGLFTHHGTVTAASAWNGPAERMRVRPPPPGSTEALLHRVGMPKFFLPLRQLGEAGVGLGEARLQRSIGVVYLPQQERAAHCSWAKLSHQFDAALFLDETHAVAPLERSPGWEAGEPPETFPSSL